jgi:alpha-D-ribose 1-methylphosphonate 5-triphosphate synthase subunit PhnG
MGGEITAPQNTIDYITIDTTGNATDFGDLTVTRAAGGSAASSTRAVYAGGSDAGGRHNTIDYVTIGTTGNATDFGDLTLTRSHLAGCSDGHGGL